MTPRDRAHGEQRVLLVAGPEETDALVASAPDLEIVVAAPTELTRRANELVVTEYRPLEVYTVLVLEYLALILIVSAAVRWLERRLQTDERN